MDAAAGATVAPPFAAVERRARARRTRAVAGVTAGVVAVLAAAALAVPDGGPRTAAPLAPTPTPTTLRRHADLASRPGRQGGDRRVHGGGGQGAVDVPRQDARSQPPRHLYPASGYLPPPMVVVDGSAETKDGHQCVNVPITPRDGSRRIAEGTAAGQRWFVVTWTSYIGSKCVGFGTDPQQQPFRVFVGYDSGLPGAAPRPR